jgi:hypothetical protein
LEKLQPHYIRCGKGKGSPKAALFRKPHGRLSSLPESLAVFIEIDEAADHCAVVARIKGSAGKRVGDGLWKRYAKPLACDFHRQ